MRVKGTKRTVARGAITDCGSTRKSFPQKLGFASAKRSKMQQQRKQMPGSWVYRIAHARIQKSYQSTFYRIHHGDTYPEISQQCSKQLSTQQVCKPQDGVTRPLQFNGLLLALGKLWSCTFAVRRLTNTDETSGRRVATSGRRGAEEKHGRERAKVGW